MKILVTAFEPFGGDSVNSSLTAMEALPPEIPVNGEQITVYKAVLPVEFGRCGVALEAALAETVPDGVISLGMAAGRGTITPEIFAVNARYARSPDNGGQTYPALSFCRSDGPAAYRTTLPAEEIAAQLNSSGIPAALSFTAGTYVCNDLFYHLMSVASVPAGFIHVPQAAEEAPEGRAAMSQEQISRGILLAVTELAQMLSE